MAIGISGLYVGGPLGCGWFGYWLGGKLGYASTGAAIGVILGFIAATVETLRMAKRMSQKS